MEQQFKTEKKFVNILETSVEALDYIKRLINEGNYTEVIPLLQTTIEGFNALYKEIHSNNHVIDEKIFKLINQLKENLINTIEYLNKGKYQQIRELIHSYLLPTYKELLSKYEDMIQQNPKKRWVIGVYHPTTNPRALLTEARIMSLVYEAERKEADIMVFSTEDVDFNQEIVQGEVFQSGQWEKMTLSFPDVIQNYSLKHDQSDKERKLRGLIPFTSFPFGGKYVLPKKLEGSIYQHYFIPSKTLYHYSDIEEFLKEYNQMVLKPIHGKKGQNIYLVNRTSENIQILKHNKREKLSSQQFENFINKLITEDNRKRYMIQPFIKSQTNEGRAYHIRAHIQKNGDGNLEMLMMYPRIAKKGSILTNVDQGELQIDISTFLEEQFKGRGSQFETDLYNISMELSSYIDMIHGFAIDELGIDFAIDENEKVWVYEVNQLPGARVDEYKRAKNAVAYAIYLAEKQIFFADPLGKLNNALQ
ncbi:YheC/YheD family protein [Texcoconibacillus texcoconensis]|uniref:ATP-grasp domain-containing protein n=1 Tax=Texcoconibacillus texcoconensis TaxID=1095777 RepID=A0A840QV30_9BACI|nr:YheC/YheD family protein [Texcoconibacillus texcoconensis]MBB5175128.1 hypothetical protein [Texcoconibacillus texcoconensis]